MCICRHLWPTDTGGWTVWASALSQLARALAGSLADGAISETLCCSSMNIVCRCLLVQTQASCADVSTDRVLRQVTPCSSS